MAGSVFVPIWFRHRQTRGEVDQVELVNWQSINIALVKDRDELRKRLDEIDAHWMQRLKTNDADWQAQTDTLRQRIRSLEQEVTDLRAVLQRYLSGGAPH
jgi:predicted nuclease with TOPRIM domain